MPVVLFRIDDRLIHGQVTVAWGAWVSPDRIVLANDDVAASDWKRELYSSTDAMGVPISVMSVHDFARAISGGEWGKERVLAVFESPGDLLRAVEGGAVVPEVNVGGMHHSEGKREVLPYVYVDDADVEALERLARGGTRLEARDVPQARSVDLMAELQRRHGGDKRGGTG